MISKRLAPPINIEGRWFLTIDAIANDGWLQPLPPELARLPKPNRAQAAFLLRMLSSDPARLLTFSAEEEADSDSAESEFGEPSPSKMRAAEYLAAQLRHIANCVDGRASWPRGLKGSFLDQNILEQAAWRVHNKFKRLPKARGMLKRLLLEEAEKLVPGPEPTHEQITTMANRIYEEIRRMTSKKRGVQTQDGN